MRRIPVTGPARRDIAKILRRSGAEFGDQALQRYRRLIDQALQDLSNDAARVGVQYPSMTSERDIFSTT